MSRKTVKKSISLREDVFEAARLEADKYFGGNFSAYLTYIICADKHGISREVGNKEPIVSRERVMNDITNYTKSDDNEDYINSILNMQ